MIPTAPWCRGVAYVRLPWYIFRDKNPSSHIELIGISVYFDRKGMTYFSSGDYRGYWEINVKPGSKIFDFQSIL